MKDLTKLIEEKAERKLNQDIRKYLHSISENELFTPLEKFTITVNEKPYSLESLFYPADGNYGFRLIHDAILPIYIERESVDFMQKVEQLQNDVNDLLNDTNCDC